MPLIGGGGAGNVAGGANPSGTGSGINYIGKHAYAYNSITAGTTDATIGLQFTTGGE